MADALSFMNGGDVISFARPDTTDQLIYCNNGIYFTDTFTAEIGLSVESGAKLSFQIDNVYVKNGTFSESGIDGDEAVPPDSDAMGYQNQYFIDNSTGSATFTLDSNFDPPTGHTYLIAMYCTSATGYSGQHNIINGEFLFYDVEANQMIANPSFMSVEFITPSIFKYKSVLYNTDNTVNSAFSNFRLGLGYNFGTIGYARNIKVAGFMLATSFATNIPCFDTRAHAEAYLRDNNITEGLLNGSQTDPADEYENARNYRYAWNIYGHNANNATQYTGFRNYRFYGGDGKICFYRVKPTTSSPYTVKLYNYSSYTIKAAGVHDTDDEDFETITNPELYFLNKSIQFADDNFYTKFKFATDLLVFGSESLAQQWVDDLIDARAAENFNDVSRVYNELIDPGYGNPDPGNDNGINGQSYVHGARMWVMSSSQLNHFFDDIFDPANITDILNGTKLFGSNEIGAIQGIAYFPIDIDDVADVYGTAQTIKIGSYSCPTAQGRYIMNNNKLIDCGSLFIAPVYNDFRDYKIKLYISLPYVGFHCLDPISKYMGKTLSVKYAVDVTTGGCTAYVYADGIFYGDSYDGFMASQRPLSGLDQTAYLNAVMGCVSSMVGRETGMLNTAVEGMAGAANGKISGGGDIAGINTSAGALGDLYGLSQAVKDTPMQTRGGFAGCLGFFGNQKIHIVTAQSKTVKPSLEQPLIGYPSHVSQTVGSFSGYLKCSYFKMAAGFNGTLEELKEIIEMMQGGIYL